MSRPTQFRCGIDTGGTFTDLVAQDEATGDLVVAKWPSSPHHPEEALIGVIRESQLPPEAFSSLILGDHRSYQRPAATRGSAVCCS